ncbi:uncharacterized protein LOC122500302 [Leptopilina heterotoma]|uniref:uncharacterized protein LOC122500302 n=1 Tax=Leptopilina heterotoma TaxID=63436 RepID=UPI001CA9DF2A|nr:uncharacterized protein LOC122500302 [Leptopilina heterotoma]
MDQKNFQYYCNFRRPPGPINIWNIVNGTINGKCVKFRIQEISDDMFDAVIDHMCTDFIRDEEFFSNFKINETRDSYEEIRIFWKEILKCGMSIVAIVDEPSEQKTPVIAGVNLLFVSVKQLTDNRTTFKDTFKTKNLSMMVKLMDKIASESNWREIYRADKYLIGFGLSVGSNFRGMSLGGHLLSARHLLSRKYGIPVSVTLFSASSAIKLAEREGYECLVEKKVTDLLNDEGKFIFNQSKSICFKFMGKRL